MKENTFKLEQYQKEPLEWFDEIPVFSKSDFYSENYERISNDHLRHFDKTGLNPFMNEDHWLEIEHNTCKFIKKYCESGNKILDVGVGMGRILDRFPEFDRYGMDISHGYLRHAKLKGIDVCLSRIEDMPYKYQYFDCVVCTDVLEHVLDLNLSFSKMVSVLKPGGFLIIRVPYRENLISYLDQSCPYDLVHLRNFDEFTIQLLVEKIFNLKLIEWDVCGFIGGIQKINVPIPKINGLFRRLIRIAKISGDDLHRSLSRVFNHPTEINFVVCNEKNKQCDQL
jgi:ubiquinone/menaquinone biosynthesis C-methylase UbiE